MVSFPAGMTPSVCEGGREGGRVKKEGREGGRCGRRGERIGDAMEKGEWERECRKDEVDRYT